MIPHRAEERGQMLYVVSTYYHALIACVKQLEQMRRADILCTGYIPDGEELAQRLKTSGLFDHTLWIDEVHEYQPTNRLDYLLSFHRKNVAQIEKSFPKGFQFEDYQEINIFHDDTWMAHYLKGKRLPYRLQEDALDNYKSISSGKFYYLLPQKGIKPFLKRIFRIGYLFLGEDGLAYEIEVNDKNGIEFASNKLIEVPREPLFQRLTKDETELLKTIFLKEIPQPLPKNAVLLLTQPLFADGFLKTEQEQLKLYWHLVQKYAPGEKLLIKPHPRDFVNYKKAFHNAVILNKNMPSELLQTILPFDISDFVPFLTPGWTQNGEKLTPKLGGIIRLQKLE